MGVLVAAAVAAGGAYAATEGDRSEAVKSAIDGGGAKNVILLIGDGMAESEITSARNYQLGAAGRFEGIDSLPLTGDKTTFSVQEDPPNKPDYDPESASTATAFSTGKKTSDGRISTLPGTTDPDNEEGNPDTIGELAKNGGLATGLVTTARLTDATPAAPSAHVPSRDCEGPEDTQEQCPTYSKPAGPGSIAEQQIDNPMAGGEGVDVLLGGGSNKYDQMTRDRRTVAQEAAAKGYNVIRNASELGDADGPKLLGLFDKTEEPGNSDPQDIVDPGNLQPEWRGQPATFKETAANGGEGQTCNEDNPSRSDEEPDLDQMTDKALELLTRDEDRGFFLEVEGASIDKRAHTAQPCEQIGETVAFDRAVKKALDFARADGNTLVIVTGDHGHASQIVESDPASEPIGCSSILRTKVDGAPMRITYATVPEATGGTCVIQEHTGTQIRIAAEGPQAANFVGLTDDTDSFTTVVRALGLGGSSAANRREPDEGGSGGSSDSSGSGSGGGSGDQSVAPAPFPARAAEGPVLSIRVRGLRRRCSRDFTARFSVANAVGRAKGLSLDGRRVAKVRLGRTLVYRVPCGSLSRGIHRLRVVGVDLTGRFVARNIRFRVSR